MEDLFCLFFSPNHVLFSPPNRFSRWLSHNSPTQTQTHMTKTSKQTSWMCVDVSCTVVCGVEATEQADGRHPAVHVLLRLSHQVPDPLLCSQVEDEAALQLLLREWQTSVHLMEMEGDTHVSNSNKKSIIFSNVYLNHTIILWLFSEKSKGTWVISSNQSLLIAYKTNFYKVHYLIFTFFIFNTIFHL